MHCTITVPHPCHEDWEQMTSVDRGRHCSACCKTVVDFTGWDVDSIADYLASHRPGAVCGRFEQNQLATRQQYSSEQWVQLVARSKTRPLYQVLLLALFAFGILLTGCHTDSSDSVSGPRYTTGLVLSSYPLQSPESQDSLHRKNASSAVDAAGSKKKSGIRKKACQPVLGEATIIEPTMGVPVLEVREEHPQTDTAVGR